MRSSLAIALALVAPSARANPWDIYGFNPRAIGMAGTHTAVADDFSAIHHNPAALTSAKDASFGFSIVATRPHLSLDFDKKPAIPALDAPNATAIAFGALFPLGGEAVAGKVAMGLGISVPTRSLLNGQALDPAIPHWYMYHAAPERIVANLSLGVAPFSFVSLGVGVQLLAGLTGSLDYELDVVAGRFSKKTVLFDIEPRAAPVLGLELRPLEGLRIGASYRNTMSASVELPVELVVTGIADLRVDTSFIVQFQPDQYTFAASYLVPTIDLLVSAELTWARWSEAPDPAVDSKLDVSGDLFEGTGLGEALDAPAPGQERQVDLAFSDIVIPRVAVERDFGLIAVRAGYAVRPSPAKRQTSGTNYVDGTAHHIGAGMSLRWQDPWDILTNPLIADLGLQLVLLPGRRHDKIDPADPIGGYTAGGNIFVAGFAFRYAFGERAIEAPRPTTEPDSPPAR